MIVQSNIQNYYYGMIASIAEDAKFKLDDGNYGDEGECISLAITDAMTLFTNRAYVLAMAMYNGSVEWQGQVKWDEISETLYDDVVDELYAIREKKQEGEQ